jgi:hypothetical protein
MIELVTNYERDSALIRRCGEITRAKQDAQAAKVAAAKVRYRELILSGAADGADELLELLTLLTLKAADAVADTQAINKVQALQRGYDVAVARANAAAQVARKAREAATKAELTTNVHVTADLRHKADKAELAFQELRVSDQWMEQTAHLKRDHPRVFGTW